MCDTTRNPKTDTDSSGQNPLWPGDGAQQPGKLPGVKRTEGAEEEVIIPVVDSKQGNKPT